MTRTLAALALAAASLAAPGSAARAEEKPAVIRIGFAGVGAGGRPVAGGNPTAIAVDHGALEAEFKADGIVVKSTYFTGAGPAVNEALANGQLDFAQQGDLPALVAKAGGLPTKLVLAQTRFDAIYVNVPASSSARSLEDLKGKRIAVAGSSVSFPARSRARTESVHVPSLSTFLVNGRGLPPAAGAATSPLSFSTGGPPSL